MIGEFLGKPLLQQWPRRRDAMATWNLLPKRPLPDAGIETGMVLAALPDPVMVSMTTCAGRLRYANAAAEQFFDTSAATLLASSLADFLPADSPVFALLD